MYELRTLCQEVLRFYIFQELGLEYDRGINKMETWQELKVTVKREGEN